LDGLSREERTLKSLQNYYREELERVQLEERLLKQQLQQVKQAHQQTVSWTRAQRQIIRCADVRTRG